MSETSGKAVHDLPRSKNALVLGNHKPQPPPFNPARSQLLAQVGIVREFIHVNGNEWRGRVRMAQLRGKPLREGMAMVAKILVAPRAGICISEGICSLTSIREPAHWRGKR